MYMCTCVYHWLESSGKKCVQSLFNYISVTDDIKNSEQNNPIANGPLYLKTKFEAIYEYYGGFEPREVSDVAILAQS